MRKNLILPVTGVELNLQQGERLYFLAGPIFGGSDWQANAIKTLIEKDPNCYIVCPCRYGNEHKLFKYSLPPTFGDCRSIIKNGAVAKVIEFPNQTMWERYYMEQASYYGCIIFWLPCEDKENPRKDGSYSRDTYGELGRWSIKDSNPDQFCYNQRYSNNRRVNVVIGGEKYFPGLSVIQKNLDSDHGKPFLIYSSMEETISSAVGLARRTNP